MSRTPYTPPGFINDIAYLIDKGGAPSPLDQPAKRPRNVETLRDEEEHVSAKRRKLHPPSRNTPSPQNAAITAEPPKLITKDFPSSIPRILQRDSPGITPQEITARLLEGAGMAKCPEGEREYYTGEVRKALRVLLKNKEICSATTAGEGHPGRRPQGYYLPAAPLRSSSIFNLDGNHSTAHSAASFGSSAGFHPRTTAPQGSPYIVNGGQSLLPPDPPAGASAGTTSAMQPEETRAAGSPARQAATRQRTNTSPHGEHGVNHTPRESIIVSSRGTAAVPQRHLSDSSGDVDDSDHSSRPDNPDGSSRMQQVEILSADINSTTTAMRPQQPIIAEVCREAAQSPRPDQTEFGSSPGTNATRPRNNGSAIENSEISPLQKSFAELEDLALRYSSLQNALQKDEQFHSHISQLKEKAQALEAQAAEARDEIERAKRSKEEEIAKAKEESGRVQQRMGTICKGLDFGGNLKLALVVVPSAESV